MVLRATRVRVLLLGAAMLGAAALARAETPGNRPSLPEVMLLPRFCWGQFLPGKFSGPQFTIPVHECGVAMNHYCLGLLALGRANRTVSHQGWRRDDLLTAKKDTEYTLRGMTSYPNCPIRAHVETTYRVIIDQLKAMP